MAGKLAIWLMMAMAVQGKPLQADASATAQDTKGNEEAAQILFGERGILTGIFRMMDQQRKVQPAPLQDPVESTKIGSGKFDFKKIVDTLVMGSNKNELGDPGIELPEVLGICNRLSCGDIYKVIDKFRKSEMFSNFQTALTLVQDPNGWETIGKLLSNPELISQFTAGSGMEELFGSALGEAQKASNMTKHKNSKLMPEDGDFGIDFSEDGEPETAKGKADKETNVAFSIDTKNEDYYGEIAKKGDESVEYEDVDVDVLPPSTPILPSSSATSSPVITKQEKLPEISFSIDKEDEAEVEGETVVVTEQLPPTTIRKIIHVGGVDMKGTGQSAVFKKREESPKEVLPRLIPTTSSTTFTSRSTTSTSTTTTTRRPRTTTTISTTTTKNYRKDNDYYVMYYDN